MGNKMVNKFSSSAKKNENPVLLDMTHNGLKAYAKFIL